MATEIRGSPIVTLRPFPHAGVGARTQGCGHGAFDPRLIWDPIEEGRG